MSYFKERIWKIEPASAFGIIRNCPKCGKKVLYGSTGNFRVNANGKCVDVWLIYQCEVCKSTYNLSILERVNPRMLDSETYRQFMENDKELAVKYGTDRALFEKNKAVIDENSISFSVHEEIVDNVSSEDIGFKEIIHVQNPHCMKIRLDRFLALQLGVSRSKVRQLLRDEIIVCGNLVKPEKQVLMNDFTLLLNTPLADIRLVSCHS